MLAWIPIVYDDPYDELAKKWLKEINMVTNKWKDEFEFVICIDDPKTGPSFINVLKDNGKTLNEVKHMYNKVERFQLDQMELVGMNPFI